jgi:hypothetical protein
VENCGESSLVDWQGSLERQGEHSAHLSAWCVKAEKLFEVRYNGETFGGIGYDNLREACESVMEAPKGSQVVQVDGKGRVLKTFSVEDCENALRSPIV